jgi:hypothetical protein
MAMERYSLTFPPQSAFEPILSNLTARFGLATKVVDTSNADDARWVTVTFTGDSDSIGRGIAYLNTLGINISPPHLAFNR